jgi:hypothetical protein
VLQLNQPDRFDPELPMQHLRVYQPNGPHSPSWGGSSSWAQLTGVLRDGVAASSV